MARSTVAIAVIALSLTLQNLKLDCRKIARPRAPFIGSSFDLEVSVRDERAKRPSDRCTDFLICSRAARHAPQRRFISRSEGRPVAWIVKASVAELVVQLQFAAIVHLGNLSIGETATVLRLLRNH